MDDSGNGNAFFFFLPLLYELNLKCYWCLSASVEVAGPPTAAIHCLSFDRHTMYV